MEKIILFIAEYTCKDYLPENMDSVTRFEFASLEDALQYMYGHIDHVVPFENNNFGYEIIFEKDN